MVQELLPLLPREAGQTVLVTACIGAVIGAGLWLTGARFSRAIITLAAVALGGALGMALPRWMSWNVHSMAAAVGGAVVLGMSGFVLHGAWVGVALGLLLACWGALGTWIFCGGGASEWTWPSSDAAATPVSFARDVWAQLPDHVRAVMPYSCAAGMLSGFLCALLWPRVAVVLLYSASGASVLLAMGLTAMHYGRPQWITMVPAQTWIQLMTLIGIVLFGAIVQWQSAPSQPSAAPKAA